MVAVLTSDDLLACTGLEGQRHETLHAFTVRLMGRVMFLYFLEKKGWLAGTARGCSWGWSAASRARPALP